MQVTWYGQTVLILVTQMLRGSLPADTLVFRIHSCIVLDTSYSCWDLWVRKVHSILRAVGFDHKERLQMWLQLLKKNTYMLKVVFLFVCFKIYFSRPLIVIGGSSDRNQETMGAFQEFPQVHRHTVFYRRVSVKWLMLFLHLCRNNNANIS